MLRHFWYLQWKLVPQPKPLMNKQTATYYYTHLISLVVSVATAVLAVGPAKIQQLFSHNPLQIVFAGAALIVAVATAYKASTCP